MNTWPRPNCQALFRSDEYFVALRQRRKHYPKYSESPVIQTPSARREDEWPQRRGASWATLQRRESAGYGSGGRDRDPKPLRQRVLSPDQKKAQVLPEGLYHQEDEGAAERKPFTT